MCVCVCACVCMCVEASTTSGGQRKPSPRPSQTFPSVTPVNRGSDCPHSPRCCLLQVLFFTKGGEQRWMRSCFPGCTEIEEPEMWTRYGTSWALYAGRILWVTKEGLSVMVRTHLFLPHENLLQSPGPLDNLKGYDFAFLLQTDAAKKICATSSVLQQILPDAGTRVGFQDEVAFLCHGHRCSHVVVTSPRLSRVVVMRCFSLPMFCLEEMNGNIRARLICIVLVCRPQIREHLPSSWWTCGPPPFRNISFQILRQTHKFSKF